jgi:hypothetical protein
MHALFFVIVSTALFFISYECLVQINMQYKKKTSHRFLNPFNFLLTLIPVCLRKCNTWLDRLAFGQVVSLLAKSGHRIEENEHDVVANYVFLKLETMFSLQIIDTQDLSQEKYDDDQKEAWAVTVQHELGKDTPSAIVLAVREDEAFTKGSYEAYTEVKRCLTDCSFSQQLVVVFTYVGERKDKNPGMQGRDHEGHQLLTKPGDFLLNVLRDAHDRKVRFNIKATGDELKKQQAEFYGIVDRVCSEATQGGEFDLYTSLAMLFFFY